MIRFKGLVVAFVLVAVSTLFFGNSAFAVPKDVTVRFDVLAAFDACPNIPGIQPSVPDGMTIDTDGNCYTPAPPPVDLCLNIPGVQAVVPSGYYRTDTGNCHPQPTPPTPPVSVCPNLPDIHVTVPDGYYLDLETNECLEIINAPEPPTGDVCLNIPGVQLATPSGMVNNDGYCHTPMTPPGTSPPETAPLKNVPELFQPIAQSLVNLVPRSVQEFFRELPADVVDRIPLYSFILVLILVLIPIPQSIREYYYKRRLLAFYRREQNIAEEKNNFIAIASHYLRTPIAIMKDSLALMSSTGEIAQSSVGTMSGALDTLGKQITTSLDIANANPALSSFSDSLSIKPIPFWRSGFFWLPIAFSVVLTVLVNFFIGIVGDKEIGTNNALFQVFVIVVFVIVLYLIVRNYHIQKSLRQEKDILITHEQTIDATRNDFLDQQATNISTALNTLYFTSTTSPPSRSYALYADGLARLGSLHDKFILLSQIKTGVNRSSSSFNLKSTIDHVIADQQANIVAKNLSVQNIAGDTMIVQNEPLFSFVIGSTIDNAIKFASPGGRVFIASRPEDKIITVRVSDNGRGIDPAKIDQLFKPFSRAESAVDFSYEGLGLSLFLNRLILTYTGGSITAASRPTGGTDVTIVTPTNITENNLDNKNANLVGRVELESTTSSTSKTRSSQLS